MDNPRPPIGFSSIKLTKDLIGVGSYGVVYKALCNEHLECAAKVIHAVLISVEEDRPEHLHRLALQRFLKEIDFLSSIRHPNIIGYLGTSQDSNNLPVLLMELMDENLTRFLERTQKSLSFNIEVNICRDIALALSFLHSNNIVHRDLSSNNVLMLGDRRAKVTDFGMATIFEDEQKTHSATKNPGAAVYMPPEVKTFYPITCHKIDCFSFGVLCVQIMTRKFPNPEDRPQGIFGFLGFDQEISRRQSHIATISKAHPLLPIALHCLKDRYKSRPTSSDICTMLGDLKNVDYDCDITPSSSEKESVVMKTPIRASSSSSSCKPKLEQTEAEKDEDVSADVSVNGGRNSQSILNEIEDGLVKLEAEMNDMDWDKVVNVKYQKRKCKGKDFGVKKENADFRRKRCLSPNNAEPLKYAKENVDWYVPTGAELSPCRDTEQKTKPVLDKSEDFNTHWSIKCTKAPREMHRTANAVYLDDGRIYMLCGAQRRTMYSFHPVTYDWLQLQDTVLELSSLTVVGSFVVTVGGSNRLQCSNKLYSLVGDHWRERLPSMPTRRYNAIVAMSDSHLIAAGGVGRNRTILNTVEVLDMDKCQWSTVSCLPEPTAGFSGHVSRGKVWILGYSNAVFSCRLDRLTQSKSSFSFTTSTVFMPVWSYDQIPVYSTTLVSMDDNLYAIGGKVHNSNKPTNAVYQYNTWNSCWYIVSHMTTVRSQCLAVGISRKKMLVVVGGISESGTPMRSVEMARLLRATDRPE